MSVKSRHLYNSKWELTYRWLKASVLGRKHYYCSCCRKDLKLGGGLANVEMHATREKHMKNEANWEEELLFPPDVLDEEAADDDGGCTSTCPMTQNNGTTATPVPM
ncbi:Hypothetical protein NTJ_10147 [Nesidiocoris tenuis]|uniref:BED-type domain-containing protein n=1 Tax=Nesidiocoris tenuis TaxID=355587 RepID=A0ABN7AYV1_9HEMI|nr:Hypothetical protein NTJ_10147 [Nesidiocoris tenuis]